LNDPVDAEARRSEARKAIAKIGFPRWSLSPDITTPAVKAANLLYQNKIGMSTMADWALSIPIVQGLEGN
jgi:hypothetical protein